MKTALKSLIYIAMCGVLVSGCSRREMLTDESINGGGSGVPGGILGNEETNLELTMDWSELGYTPTGMTVLFYPVEGGEPATFLTNNVHTTPIGVKPGTYNIVVFNNSYDEFASVGFKGFENYKLAEIFYTGKSAKPEGIALVSHTGYEVTKEERKLLLKPERLLVNGDLQISVRGANNIRYAKGHITGLAGSYMVAAGVPKAGEENFKTPTNSWKLKQKEGELSLGTLSCNFSTFGLPEIGWKEENDVSPNAVMMHLSLLLVDNKTVLKYSFPIGDIIQVWEQNGEPVFNVAIDGVDGPIRVDIPDVKPVDGSSNDFGADVEDWGDDEDWEMGV